MKQIDLPDLKSLNNEEAERCKDFLTIKERADAKFHKTPGSDGLTIEFHSFLWELIGHIMVDSFNYGFMIVSFTKFSIVIESARTYL